MNTNEHKMNTHEHKMNTNEHKMNTNLVAIITNPTYCTLINVGMNCIIVSIVTMI